MEVIVLALKDLRLLVRDRVALFWVFGFPVAFALFIGAVVRAGLDGDTGPLRVVLVDHSQTESSRRISEALTRQDRLRIEIASPGEARRQVRHAEAIAYLELPKGFGATEHGTRSLQLGFDPAREMEVAFLEQLLGRVMASAHDGTALTAPPLIERKELVLASVRQGASDLVFPSAVLWGLMGCTACFAVSLVGERTRKTYARLRAMPVRRSSLLAGKALSSLVASLAVAVTLTSIATLCFDVSVASVGKLALALLSTSLCFVGISMALSVTGRTEQAVGGAGWATLLLMAMLGGAMVPLSLMPDWLGPISNVSPVKWGFLALEGATWRGFSMAELMVPCLVLLSVGGFCFLVGARVLTRTDG